MATLIVFLLFVLRASETSVLLEVHPNLFLHLFYQSIPQIPVFRCIEMDIALGNRSSDCFFLDDIKAVDCRFFPIPCSKSEMNAFVPIDFFAAASDRFRRVRTFKSITASAISTLAASFAIAVVSPFGTS